MMTTNTQQEAVDMQKVAIWTAVAAVAAAVINAILFVVASSQFDGLLGNGQPFSIGLVIGASLVSIAFGGIFLAILARFSSRPITIWRWIAIGYLLLSFAFPFVFLEGDEGVTVTMTPRIILILMHIIAGGLVIYLLTTRTQESA
jgi:Family of unknown function (DUF6069)